MITSLVYCFMNVNAYNSTYNILIPKNIVLNGNTGIAEYNLFVNGNIASGETSNLSINPDSNNFILKNITKNKDIAKKSLNATITQNDTNWSYSEIKNGTTKKGKIKVSNLTAGNWNGTFNFAVKINTNSMKINSSNYVGTYDGNSHTGSLSVSSPSNATIKYGTSNGIYNLSTIPSYVDAGNYTIYYQISASDYTTKTGTLSITINKANVSLTQPTIKGTLIYNGAAQELINVGSTSNGTILYGLSTSSTTEPTIWSSNIPTGTNAGTYYIWAKVIGDKNHNDINPYYLGSVNIHSHNYSSTITKEATCTDSGIRTYTCSCGNSYTETIEALGHLYSGNTTLVKATSSTSGHYYTGSVCLRCGQQGSHTSTTPCTFVLSNKKYTCSVCGFSYTAGKLITSHSSNIVKVTPTIDGVYQTLKTTFNDNGYAIKCNGNTYTNYIISTLPDGSLDIAIYGEAGNYYSLDCDLWTGTKDAADISCNGTTIFTTDAVTCSVNYRAFISDSPTSYDGSNANVGWWYGYYGSRYSYLNTTSKVTSIITNTDTGMAISWHPTTSSYCHLIITLDGI